MCNTALDGTSGRDFDVCCPNCARGTYLPGQSCKVILPDPGACGLNIVDSSGASMSKGGKDDDDDTDASDLDGLLVDSSSSSSSTSTSNGDASSSSTTTTSSST